MRSSFLEEFITSILHRRTAKYQTKSYPSLQSIHFILNKIKSSNEQVPRSIIENTLHATF